MNNVYAIMLFVILINHIGKDNNNIKQYQYINKLFIYKEFIQNINWSFGKIK